MTQIITPQQEAIQQYLAGLGQTTYVYPFLILQASDLNVYVTAPNVAANPINDLVPSSNYTVTGVGVVTGGTAIFNVAPAQGSTVTVARNMQLAITTQFNDAQNFNGASLDSAFQRIVLLLQQMQGNYTINAGMVGSISRCLQYAIDTFLPTGENNLLPLLTNIDNQVWISQGGAIVAAVLQQNPDTSTLRAQLAIKTATGSGASLIGYFDQNSGTPETLNQYLNISNIYGLDTGSVNALVVAPLASSQFVSYQTAMIVRALVANTNTAASTIAVGAAGTVNIKRSASAAILPGDMIAGQIAEMQFDGTEFLLLNPQAVTYYGADTSVSANTITVAVSPPIAAYTTGSPVLLVKIANTNTGATTINVNAIGSKSVKLADGSALIGNELIAGMIAEFAYDGVNMQLLNPARLFASNAQALAGTDTTHMLSSAALASSTTAASPGTLTLPGGLIMKWGITSSITASGNQTVNFGTAFPNNAFIGEATPLSTSASAKVAINSLSASAIRVNNLDASNPCAAYWFVIGN